jgi:hypothetical protein
VIVLIEQNFDNNNENCIEFLSGERFTTVSFSNRKHINRIKKIYEERKDEFKYFHINQDGSICAKFPLKWIKINPGAKPDPTRPKRIVSDEQKKKMQQALENYRKNIKKK